MAIFTFLYDSDNVNALTMNEKNSLEFRAEKLYLSQELIELKQIINQLPNSNTWQYLLQEKKEGFVWIDKRSGRPAALTFSIPLIPGSGKNNNITLNKLSQELGYSISNITEKEIKYVVLRFLQEYSKILDIDLNEIDEIRISNPVDYLWNIFITRKYKDLKVRDSNIVIVINHGNVILWGLEKWGDIRINAIPMLNEKEALARGIEELGINSLSSFIKGSRMEIIPATPISWDGTIGNGYEYILAWVFTFEDGSTLNRWEMIVDANNGELLSFNKITPELVVGSIYPLSNDECCPDGCAEYASIMYGASQTNGCTNLNGINDLCGAINECSSTFYIDMRGSNAQHNCEVPELHSAGDTFASRTVFHEVRNINSIARSWVYYPWLDSSISISTNGTNYCSASWTGSGIICSRSGNGCRNTCEIASIPIHEWAHGLDDNDTNGVLSNPMDVFGDALAALRLHSSCIGRGFYWTLNRGCGQWTNCPTNPGISYGYNCDGYGDCCISCTGIREIDYALHSTATPHTPASFNCIRCNSGTGPCGKEVHCESAPASEAIWDLAARDLQSAPFYYDKQTAFMITTRLAYIGSGSITNWYSCSCPNVSNGCAATNGYMQWIAADDDDGDINSGTPHMTAIYAAFNRHGIACDAPQPVNKGCPTGPSTAPIVNATAGDKTVSLAWNNIPNASYYAIFRTEGILGCDSGKYKIATTTSTSYNDTNLPNNRTYYYAVMPIGSNQACYGPLSNCVSAKPLSSCPPNAIGNTLIVSKSQNTLYINWSYDGCCWDVFALYRGSLPFASYNHLPVDCSITTASYQMPIGSDSYYFLAVASANGEESSYGKDSDGNERPQSTFPCYPQYISGCY